MSLKQYPAFFPFLPPYTPTSSQAFISRNTAYIRTPRIHAQHTDDPSDCLPQTRLLKGRSFPEISGTHGGLCFPPLKHTPFLFEYRVHLKLSECLQNTHIQRNDLPALPKSTAAAPVAPTRTPTVKTTGNPTSMLTEVSLKPCLPYPNSSGQYPKSS